MKQIESKHLQLFLGLATSAGALVTIILYFENKETRKLQKGIAMNELKIKELDLAEKQRRNKELGLKTV